MKLLKRTKLLSLIILSIAITGCTASGVAFQKVQNIPEGKALIYFYRVGTMAGVVGIWGVTVNGEEVGSIKSGGYIPYFCKPGYAKIEGTFGLGITYEPIDLNIKEGGTYYIRFHNVGGILSATFAMDIPDEETAILELYDCSLQE